ncbi:MAG TPA: hypothetical protein EYP41_22135 [Anaerolineae bacterium]|nr:hypothetical protein [Anaerolineae bacterium]HIP73622.1 hypothetical protein [Anaerolineae bacterium]
MNVTLNIEDPLADQEVSIVITLTASTQPREARPSLISVGVAGQLPVTRSGVFGDALALIHEAWTAFGARAQAAAATTESDTITEEQVVATAAAGADEPAPMSSATLSTPKPQAKNLSLF